MSVGVWDLDPMLDRVLVAELPQDVVGGDGGHYVHFDDGDKVGVGEQSKPGYLVAVGIGIIIRFTKIIIFTLSIIFHFYKQVLSVDLSQDHKYKLVSHLQICRMLNPPQANPSGVVPRDYPSNSRSFAQSQIAHPISLAIAAASFVVFTFPTVKLRYAARQSGLHRR